MSIQTRFKCPRCEKMSEGYPALCRADNKTEICSACGTDEAMLNMTYSLKQFFEYTMFWQKEAGIDCSIAQKRLREVLKCKT